LRPRRFADQTRADWVGTRAGSLIKPAPGRGIRPVQHGKDQRSSLPVAGSLIKPAPGQGIRPIQHGKDQRSSLPVAGSLTGK
jgi:hypothetical protein